jgi:thymidylate synthase
MINIDEEYKGLVSGVLHGGIRKSDRTGTGIVHVFGRQIEHDMELGFPLLTTKKVWFNHALTELIWMLQGRTDVKFLTDNKVNYWTPDYERSGRTDGTLGKVYGYQWRNFNGVDQIKELMLTLKNEPTSRRMVVSAWNPADMNDMVLPPCHYGFQVSTRGEYLDLLWTQRSVDVFLGLPYDIAIYGLLLLYLAEGAGYKPGRLVAQLGDCHLYSNHLEAAKELVQRNIKELPKVVVKGGLRLSVGNDILIPRHEAVELKNYNPHPAIKAPLSVGMGH